MLIKGASLSLIKNFLFDIVKTKFTADPFLKPMCFVYYPTLRCNFRCSFCGFAQTQEQYDELDTQETIRLLKIISQSCSCIYFTGGEPLVKEDITEILQAARQLFKLVTFNTNLSIIDKKLEILKCIDNLVVSINQMDDRKTADTKGISLKMAQRVKENLAICLEARKRERFSITVNCVITRDSLNDTLGVMEYCFNNNINFAVVPAVRWQDGRQDEVLVNSAEYKDLIKFILKAKKNRLPVFNSFLYLDQIVNFRPFNCYPTLLPHIYPNGDFLYPCQAMRQVAGNILKVGSYEDCLKEGIRKYGNVPNCKNKCYMACYLESSAAIEHPLKYFSSIIRQRI